MLTNAKSVPLSVHMDVKTQMEATNALVLAVSSYLQILAIATTSTNVLLTLVLTSVLIK